MKIKGLNKFISEVNDPKSTTTPEYRIQLELVKIKKSLIKKKKKKMYNTKKCIAKLCYIELYGCHVTFGFPQILTLLRSRDLSDNFFGCLATVILSGNNESFIMELIPEMRRFLTDTQNDLGICFALNAISYFESADLADSLGPAIADIVIQPNVSEYARKKAMLILAKIYQTTRQYPSIDRITPKLSSFLLSNTNGIIQCASTLILSIIQSQSVSIIDFFPIVIEQLCSIVHKNEYDKETIRGKMPCPFLITKYLRILIFKLDWTESDKEKIESVVSTLLDLIDLIIGVPPLAKTPSANSPLTAMISPSSSSNLDNHSSFLPSYMIFSEISDLAASVPFNSTILDRIIKRLLSLIDSNSPYVLGSPFLPVSPHPKKLQDDVSNIIDADSYDSSIKEVDLCFFAINKLNLIVRSVPLSSQSVHPIQSLLIKMMQKRNILVDVRAINLLYAIATNENGVQIAQEMINFIPKAPIYLRESLCMKAAVLIQSYSTDDENIIYTLINILQIGGKFLDKADSVWRSIVQTVSLKTNIQKKVTEDVYSIIKSAALPPIALIKLASFLIGEYGETCTSFDIKSAVDLLCSLFNKANDRAQSMILTALMKLVVKSSDVKTTVRDFFRKHITSLSYEVAQRSKEYVKLLSLPEKVLKKIIISSSSNARIVSEIFATKTVVGEMPQIEQNNGNHNHQFDDRHDLVFDDALFNQFQKEDTGILLKNQNFIIRAAVRYDQPRLSMIVNIENLTSQPIVIKDFSVDSNDELRFRIVDLPSSIDSNDRTSIPIDFVMMDMTDRLPILNLMISKRLEKSGNSVASEKVETVSTPLPIFFNRWFLPFDIDEESFRSRWASIVDPQLVGIVQLMIPDGDVMEETIKIMKEKFGLEPLKFKIAENNIVYAGAFKCFNGNIGVLLGFVYDEANMNFSFHVKANVKSAIKVIVDVTRTAFLS